MSSMCVTWVNIEIFNVFQGRYTLSAFINIKIVHELEDVDKNIYQENHFEWIKEKWCMCYVTWIVLVNFLSVLLKNYQYF